MIAMTTNPTRLVFVYGTLKKDYPRYEALNAVAEKGPMWLKNHVMVHLHAFPAIVPFDGYDVLGEVYEVDSGQIRLLDQIEGVSTDLYRRKQIATPWGNAEVYYQPENRLRTTSNIIPTGVWLGSSTYSQPWHGDKPERELLSQHPSASRVLSQRRPDGRLDVWTMQVLRKQAALPAQPAVMAPPRVLPPPAPTVTYPVLDLADNIGPGFEEG